VVAVEVEVVVGEAMEVAEMVDTEVEVKEDMVVAKEVTTRVDMEEVARVVMAIREDMVVKEVMVVDITKEAMTRARVVDMASNKAGEVVVMARVSLNNHGEHRARPAALVHMTRATVVDPPEPLQGTVSRGLPPMVVEAKEDMVEEAREDMVVEAKEDMVVAGDTKFDRAPSSLGRGKMNVGPRTSVADVGL